ncbi:LLM class flavin-dependent oxidoreductase [Bacillus pacificus]
MKKHLKDKSGSISQEGYSYFDKSSFFLWLKVKGGIGSGVWFWLPIFGGWLRNVNDESMPPTFEYAKQTAQAAEQLGFSTTLIAELNLNDIKRCFSAKFRSVDHCGSTAAVTDRLEIMTAVRPGFHNPAVTAKMAANIDQLSNGRFTLNVVSAWWEEEAKTVRRSIYRT